MSKNENNSIAALGCIGLVALIPLMSVANGYVISILWSWFVVPVFHLPALGVFQSIGLAMVAAIFTYQDCASTKYDEWYHSIIAALMRPGLSLLFGWIVKSFL